MKQVYESPQMETVTFEKCDVLTLSVGGGGYGKEEKTSLIKGNGDGEDSISFGDLGF